MAVHKIGTRLSKEKLRKRVSLHSNLSSFHEKLGTENIPTCMGGNGLEYNSTEMLTLLVEILQENDKLYEGKYNYGIYSFVEICNYKKVWYSNVVICFEYSQPIGEEQRRS